MNQFFSSLREFIATRTSTPIWANFVLLWLIYNWHIVLLLLYTESGDAISLINIIRNHDFQLWWPILYSLVLTIAMPYVNLVLYSFIEYGRVLKENVRLKLSNKELKGLAEYNKIVSEKIELQKRYDQNQELIAGLQQSVQNANGEKDAAINDFENCKEQLLRLENLNQVNNETISLYTLNHNEYLRVINKAFDIKIVVEEGTNFCKFNGVEYLYTFYRPLSQTQCMILLPFDSKEVPICHIFEYDSSIAHDDMVRYYKAGISSEKYLTSKYYF